MQTGKAFLVDAGPGDPELLTVKAVKILRSADVVLHDSLVSPEILALVSHDAKLIDVGKRCGTRSTLQEDINKILVQYSLMGLNVVRLKGGDPFIFGRGGEELEALRQAGIETEIVPGITAALGAAAGTQIPLTHRDISSTLILVTGNSRNAEHIANWPCAIISGATIESEQIHLTVVANLFAAPRLTAARLLVVGEVVRFAEARQLREQFNADFVGPQFSAVSSNTGESA